MPKPLAGLIEKVLATYVEALIVAILAAGPLDLSTAQAAAFAAIPAALTVIANRIPASLANLSYWTDFAYRVVATAAVTFLGYLVALPVFDLDRSVLTAAGTAAGTAALAAAKSLLASKIGRDDTAAVLPVSVDPKTGRDRLVDAALHGVQGV